MNRIFMMSWISALASFALLFSICFSSAVVYSHPNSISGLSIEQEKEYEYRLQYRIIAHDLFVQNDSKFRERRNFNQEDFEPLKASFIKLRSTLELTTKRN